MNTDLGLLTIVCGPSTEFWGGVNQPQLASEGEERGF